MESRRNDRPARCLSPFFNGPLVCRSGRVRGLCLIFRRSASDASQWERGLGGCFGRAVVRVGDFVTASRGGHAMLWPESSRVRRAVVAGCLLSALSGCQLHRTGDGFVVRSRWFRDCDANSPLKKGTGSELMGATAAENDGREVPVPLFQRAASPRPTSDLRTGEARPAETAEDAATRVGPETSAGQRRRLAPPSGRPPSRNCWRGAPGSRTGSRLAFLAELQASCPVKISRLLRTSHSFKTRRGFKTSRLLKASRPAKAR